MTNSNEATQTIGYVLSFGSATIKRSYKELVALVDYQTDLLQNEIPYSLYNQNELHIKLVNYIDLCILNLNQLITARALSKQNFPPEHYLLRKYRDHSQHVDSQQFKPIQWADGDNSSNIPRFYIWPNLRNISAIAREQTGWINTPNKVELKELILLNQKYIEQILASVAGKVRKSGIEYKFPDYHFHVAGVNPDTIISNDESWGLILPVKNY